jgi:hypothetical protein
MALFIRQQRLNTVLWLVCVFPVNEGAANDASFVRELHGDVDLSRVTDRKRARKR